MVNRYYCRHREASAKIIKYYEVCPNGFQPLQAFVDDAKLLPASVFLSLGFNFFIGRTANSSFIRLPRGLSVENIPFLQITSSARAMK
mmetsp:Transcript_24400/g.52282  ORF Transcript_24400/g.52282 Transcript_24400/m.52282 type:complete len:88 (+) Transcript_24400:85-348(+)